MEPVYLYILGAGASEPDGMPLTSEIIDTAFWNFGGKYDGRNEYAMGPWEKEDVFEKIKPVFELMDHFYGTGLVKILENYYKEGYHPHTFGLTTDIIEDFFTRLYYFKKGTNNYNLTLNRDSILKISKNADYLFFYTLSYAALGQRPYKNYGTFIERFLRRKGRHCIISFNYDLLIEDVLFSMNKYLRYDGRVWNYPDDLKFSYCIDFDNILHREAYPFPEFFSEFDLKPVA